MPNDITWSAKRKKIEATSTITNTMAVVMRVSRRVGQVTFAVSARTCWKNWVGLFLAMSYTFVPEGFRHLSGRRATAGPLAAPAPFLARPSPARPR